MGTTRPFAAFTIKEIESLRRRIVTRLSFHSDGCVLWTGAINNKGYGVIGIGSTTTVYVHRAVWFLTHKRWPIGILHNCDRPLCVLHLSEGDQSANLADMRAKGRHSHILSEEEKQEIRSLYQGQRYKRDGVNLKSLARTYGVHLSTIHAVVTRR